MRGPAIKSDRRAHQPLWRRLSETRRIPASEAGEFSLFGPFVSCNSYKMDSSQESEWM